MKNLAEFKKMLKNKEIELLSIFNSNWENETLPDRLTGWLKPVKCDTAKYITVSENGIECYHWFKPASLYDFTDDTVTIYKPAYRELTPEEQGVMKEWETIKQSDDFRDQCMRAAYQDSSEAYYTQKYFFESKNMDHLMGIDTYKGMRYDRKTNKVIDEHIKGDIDIQYKYRKI